MSERYVRQMRVPGVGVDGQRRLSEARVLLVGAGGLGAPAALYLAGAGVGTVGLIDDDVVELSNLHRQIVHTTASVGRPKTDSARETLSALNPEIRVETFETRLTARNALELVRGWDLVLDGADDFATRCLVSDAATLLGIPHVWASVMGSGGQLSVFDAARGPVYRDAFPVLPAPGSVPSCAQAGVLPVVPGILGVAMAAEALKLILGVGSPLIGQVAVYDMLTAAWETVPVRPHPAVQRPQTAAEVGAGLPPAVTVEELASVLAGSGATASAGVRGSAPRERSGISPLVIDVRTAEERAAGTISGSVHVPVEVIEADPAGAMSSIGAGDGRDGDPADALGSGEAPESGSAPHPRRSPGSGDGQGSAPGVSSAGEICYVFCAAGGRSARAAHALRGAGIEAVDVIGGYEAWERRIGSSAAAVPVAGSASVAAGEPASADPETSTRRDEGP